MVSHVWVSGFNDKLLWDFSVFQGLMHACRQVIIIYKLIDDC